MPEKAAPRWHTNSSLWGKLKPLARLSRHSPTPEEQILWAQLRNRRLAGYKFRRQYTLDRFIVDFYCKERKLVIEVDGEIHLAQQEQDTARTQILESLGFRVLRIRNNEVQQQLESVLARIKQALD